MDLFSDVFDARKPARAGFRMERMEVLNWGTFDKAVWPLQLHGDTTLLTGDIGSGKSTIVDAFLTLLIPTAKLAYNKAADSSARERSASSYTRGYIGKKFKDGVEMPEALRDKNKISVILAVFHDELDDSWLTLAQVFWYRQAENKPSRFMVIAERDLTIKKDFSDFGKSIADLKKKLKNTAGVRVFETFSEYVALYENILGITQSHAMELLQQIVSMKKVNSITEFVRKNMLDDQHYYGDLQEAKEKALKGYRDLAKIYNEILLDKEKIELLKPVREKGNSFLENKKRTEELNTMQNGLKAWFAEEEKTLRSIEMTDLENRMAKTEKDITRCQEMIQRNEDERIKMERMYLQQGGSKIESMEQYIRSIEDKLTTARRERTRYEKLAVFLGLNMPGSQEEMDHNRDDAQKILNEQNTVFNQKDREKSENEGRERELKTAVIQNEQELDSLKKRTSNIPADLVDVRSKLSLDTGIPSDHMPFAGEIMEVKKTEEEWEGPLEKLFRDFGTTMLVSAKDYGTVAEWMENHDVGLKLTYNKVENYAGNDTIAYCDPNTACGKIVVKETSPYATWLCRELKRRYPHVCVINIDEFMTEKNAVSVNGQVKTDELIHRKNDTFATGDIRSYVMGFSNKEKIRAIEADTEKIKQKLDDIRLKIEEIVKERQNAGNLVTVAKELLTKTDYSEMDSETIEKDKKEKEAILQSLKEGNDLKKMQDSIKGIRRTIDELRDEEQKNLGYKESLRTEQQKNMDKMDELERMIAEVDQEERRKAAYLLKNNAHLVGKIDEGLTLTNIVHRRNRYDSWLKEQMQEMAAVQSNLSGKLAALMGKYLYFIQNHMEFDPELTGEVEEKNIAGFCDRLKIIEENDLPQAQEKMRKELREKTIQGVAEFHAKYKEFENEITERIDDINKSLRSIDYEPGCYIYIKCDKSKNEEIRHFKQDLKQATENILDDGTGSYTLEKFEAIKKLLERMDANRPDRTDADIRWTNFVTDVRNCYMFGASLRKRPEDGSEGEEIEFYSDSSGKSGGQKEKLAYTILAASFVYTFGINFGESVRTFRFAAIDEAFLKSSDESAKYALELFKKLGIQLLIVTPLAKIPTIEPFVSQVGFVSKDKNRSKIKNMTIAEYRKEQEKYGGKAV